MTSQDSSQPAGAGSSSGSPQGGSHGAQTASRIPAAVAAKSPDLEALILQTESMTDEEREYWFQILPIMTEVQIEKLRGILIHEKEQLAKLDSNYQNELAKINDKHMRQWKVDESRAEREKREAEEKAHESAEKAAEADLLSQLEDDEPPPATNSGLLAG